MSIHTRDHGLSRRRNRVYGTHELSGARSSVTSLSSNATGISNNSAGSVSTVTQGSYTKSRQSVERKKARRASTSGEKVEASTAEPPHTTKASDVFNFLVEEEMNKFKLNPIQPEMEMKDAQNTVVPKQEIMFQPGESDSESFYKSQLSDSGISMGSSLEDSHPEYPCKQPLPPLLEEVNDFSLYVPPPASRSVYSPSAVDHPVYMPLMGDQMVYGTPYTPAVDPYYHNEAHVWNHYPPAVYSPEPMPLSPASTRSHVYPHEYTYRDTPEPPSTDEPSISCLDSAPLVFRDNAIKAGKQPQVFRSFAKVTTRILLQMQSNIADLEHELAILDAKTVSSETSTKRRKGERHSRHSERDRSHRTDLYQELRICLEQYYEALSSYNRFTQITSPSQPSDVTKLRSWLHNCVAPSTKVSSLIGDGSDLVRLGNRSNVMPEETFKVVAYSVFVNLFIPLLLFKILSSVLSRLTLLSFTTMAATLVLDRYHMGSQVELGNLYWHCILGSAGVSLVAALLF